MVVKMGWMVALATGMLAARAGADAFQNAGAISRVSVAGDGAEANGGSSRPAVSGDGSRIAFYSDADNLVPGDGNGFRDIFVRDRTAGTTVLASLSGAGAAGNGLSGEPALSADGRHVAFYSDADNLVPGDGNGRRDVFVRDLEAGTTVRVSVSTGGGESNGLSEKIDISGDGRRIVFRSSADNLVPGDTNGVDDIFVRDRDVDGNGIFDEPGGVATIRVSVASDGTPSDNESSDPCIAKSGRYVAFRSSGTTLVSGDTNSALDVFVHDLETGATIRASVNSSGAQGFEESAKPSISADGRFVAFWSNVTDLVPGDTNEERDVFVHDRDRDGDGIFDEPGGLSTVRVSVSTSGQQSVGSSEDPSISDDGRFVTFWSEGPDLVPNDQNLSTDVFRHDRDLDGNGIFDESGGTSTIRLSVNDLGLEGNGESDRPKISGNGRVVAFKSVADNLVPGDGNATRDIFIREFPELIFGDVSGDGLVNALDIMCVLDHWGPCPADGACIGDLTGDGVVDVDDLVAVLFNWKPV